MSQENHGQNQVDLDAFVASLYDALDRRDLDTVAALIHPDCEFHSRIAASEGRFYKGRKGIADYFRDVDETFEKVRRGQTEIVGSQGNKLALVSRIRGEGRGSGVPVDVITPQVWTLRDGKLWRCVVYNSRAEALEAAGLSE